LQGISQPGADHSGNQGNENQIVDLVDRDFEIFSPFFRNSKPQPKAKQQHQAGGL